MMDKEAWTFKNIFQRQTKLAAYIIICATLVVIGASYALFFQVDSNTNNQIVEAGDLTFTYSNETVINNSICFEPMSLDEANLYASSCSYQLSIRNTGTLIADYDLYLVPREDNTADLSNLKLILRRGGELVIGYPKGIVSGTGDSTHVGTTDAFLGGVISPGQTILYSAQIYVDDTTSFAGSENKKVSFDIRGALRASDTNPITGTRPSAANTLAALQLLNSNFTVTPSTSYNPDYSKIAPYDASYTPVTMNAGLEMDENSYVTYGDAVTYDTIDKIYSLTNPITCQWGSCYSNAIGKYAFVTDNGGLLSLGSDSNTPYVNVEVTEGYNVAYIRGATALNAQVTAYENDDFYRAFISFESGQQSGLYETVDDYGTSYYFRGSVDNNYVQFGNWANDYYEGYVSTSNTYQNFTSLSECTQVAGDTCQKYASQGDDMYWRIVRINGDGSIRMVYDGTSITYPEDEIPIRRIGNSPYNTSTGDNAYVGYMYGTAGSNNYNDTHANTNDSTVKMYLDTWYENNLKNTTYESYIADSIFCNDRSVASVETITYANANLNPSILYTVNAFGNNNTVYGGYGRMIDETLRSLGNKATLNCQNKNDRFTVNDTTVGNGALTYPVGLLTIDEINMAGMGASESGMYATDDCYLNITIDEIWTMTPMDQNVASLKGGNLVTEAELESSHAIRPVINLKPGSIIRGNGTAASPFGIVAR